jgi:hypothetical protein
MTATVDTAATTSTPAPTCSTCTSWRHSTTAEATGVQTGWCTVKHCHQGSTGTCPKHTHPVQHFRRCSNCNHFIHSANITSAIGACPTIPAGMGIHGQAAACVMFSNPSNPPSCTRCAHWTYWGERADHSVGTCAKKNGRYTACTAICKAFEPAATK